MSSPVTVLMPNFNNGQFLIEAIDSILTQSFSDFTLLIVDDGSSDNSVELIKAYSDSRIQLVQKPKNSGIVDALNVGLDIIQSRYMVRMDGDDISDPNRLELLFNFMEQNPDVGICSSHLERFGDVSSVDHYELNEDRIKAKLIYATSLAHAGSIMRMSVLNENNIRYRANHPYMEDYDLFFRLKNVTKMVTMDKLLYKYRILKHNSTVANIDSLLSRYHNFYRENVFPELQLESSEENLRLHAELLLWPERTFPFKRYQNWIDKILSQNIKLNVYPQKALEQELLEKWDRFFFLKVADKSIATSFDYFLGGGTIKAGKIEYLVKTKLNRLIGRRTS